MLHLQVQSCFTYPDIFLTKLNLHSTLHLLSFPLKLNMPPLLLAKGYCTELEKATPLTLPYQQTKNRAEIVERAAGKKRKRDIKMLCVCVYKCMLS